MRATNERDRAKSEAEHAQAIFEGTVVKLEMKSDAIAPVPPNVMSITPSGKELIVTFRAIRVYRGSQETIFVVVTGIGCGDCGFDFQEGDSYLVYAGATPSGQLFTSICSGTTLLDDAGPELRFLRGEPLAPEDIETPRNYPSEMMRRRTGTLCGHVYGMSPAAAKNLSVSLWEMRGKQIQPCIAVPADTKPDGSFCATGVPPGKYLLGADAGEFSKTNTQFVGYYPGVKTASEAAPIEIKAGSNISALELPLQTQALYMLRGHVVTSDGSKLPADGVEVGLARDDRDPDPLSEPDSQSVGADGSFSFSFVASGQYYLVAFFDPDDAGETASQWKASKIDITVLEDMADIVIKLIRVK